MDKKEFLKQLKENKWSSNPDELIKIRLPIVQYYLTNYSNAQVFDNKGNIFSSKSISIEFNKDTDFPLLNQAYESVRKQLIKS